MPTQSSLSSNLEIEFPEKLAFLFEPHPYKIAFGGRDGTKSWGFATALIEMASSLYYWVDMGRKNLRVLCARETQKSIDASVHQLLADTIIRLKLEDRFTVQEQKIICPNGGFIIFAGLKHNPDAIKSAEGVDIVWVEEAQNVSKDSWNKLLPTIRKGESEVWASFNPQFETDDTYERFVIHPPPGAVVVRTGWEDNRWLSERSRVAIEHMRLTDPRQFDHVYGGECQSAVEGAIYAEEIKQAEAEGRIGAVPYNRTKPVDTVWDLGYEDFTVIWFVQAYGGWLNFIDYLEDYHRSLEWWAIQLQNRAYVYGTDWLPHDGVDAIIHKKLVSATDKSPEQILRALGRSPRLIQKLQVSTRINAGRMVFPTCRFDRDKCEEGLRALRMYQWGEPSSSGALKREPLHDAYSHGADAFQYAAIAMEQPSAPEPARIVKPQRRTMPEEYSPFG